MPKPITLEMVQAMTPDQRKTLHRNASSLDTPAAQQVLILLSQDGMTDKASTAAKAPARASNKTPARTSATRASAAKTSTATAAKSPRLAKHGRQA